MSYGAADRAGWRQVDWAYDALGRRIRQTSHVLSNGVWVVTEDLKLVSDPVWFGRHVAELNATNHAVVRSYVWGLDLSETLDGVGGVGGLLGVQIAGGPGAGTHFVTYDGNGNVWQLVFACTATETARYEYAPFGEPLRTTGLAAPSNPFRFSTKRTDSATVLVLYEYRAYSPGLGRWLSRDPMLSDEALSVSSRWLGRMTASLGHDKANLYGFVLQNPIGSVDHLGLFTLLDVAETFVDHSVCLAATLGLGQCCSERFTVSVPAQEYEAGLFRLEFKLEWRTQIQKCRECCVGGGQGDRVTISSDLRGTMELKVRVGVIPTPVPILVRAYGGASIGGALVYRLNTCTGLKTLSGCQFVNARFGAEGCASLGVGEVCLRAEGAYRHRTCVNPDLNSDCLVGQAMLRFKVLSRSYDVIIWQTAPCATN